MESNEPPVKPTLKELLLTDTARAELAIPPRGRWRRRVVSSLSGADDDRSNELQ
jgi:hypothetical protein